MRGKKPARGRSQPIPEELRMRAEEVQAFKEAADKILSTLERVEVSPAKLDEDTLERLLEEGNITPSERNLLVGTSSVLHYVTTYIPGYWEEKARTERKEGTFKMSMHSLAQLYKEPNQKNLFSTEKLDQVVRATGISQFETIPNNPGLFLNQSEQRVWEGIMRAFSETNYKGDELVDTDTSLESVKPLTEEAYKALRANDNAPYRDIPEIPVIRLTQAELIRLSGYGLTQGDKMDVVEAINTIATKQFCFYWKRLKKRNGKPVLDKNHEFIKEEVMEVGTLLRVKQVRDEKQELKYYEIHPSAVLLDQINTYFLLIPNAWREEVKRLTGKSSSRYTYQLLGWLRLQFEHIRRHNVNLEKGKKGNKRPFTITRTWEEIAEALNMPESMYKANRARASKIIREAYDVARKLGYLERVELGPVNDTLYLKESYYPTPGKREGIGS